MRTLRDTAATALAAFRHRDTPRRARATLLLVAAYALSPLDLIPDPIAGLGILDDAVVIPLGVMLALRMVPSDVLDDIAAEKTDAPNRRRWRLGAFMVILLALGLSALSITAVRYLLLN